MNACIFASSIACQHKSFSSSPARGGHREHAPESLSDVFPASQSAVRSSLSRLTSPFHRPAGLAPALAATKTPASMPRPPAMPVMVSPHGTSCCSSSITAPLAGVLSSQLRQTSALPLVPRAPSHGSGPRWRELNGSDSHCVPSRTRASSRARAPEAAGHSDGASPERSGGTWPWS